MVYPTKSISTTENLASRSRRINVFKRACRAMIVQSLFHCVNQYFNGMLWEHIEWNCYDLVSLFLPLTTSNTAYDSIQAHSLAMLHRSSTFFYTARCYVMHHTLEDTLYFITHSMLFMFCDSICINGSCKRFARLFDDLWYDILMWMLNRLYTDPSRSAI